jgi:hypothetical protein
MTDVLLKTGDTTSVEGESWIMNKERRIDAYDTQNGKYSAHKIPRWSGTSKNLMLEYLRSMEQQDPLPHGYSDEAAVSGF